MTPEKAGVDTDIIFSGIRGQDHNLIRGKVVGTNGWAGWMNSISSFSLSTRSYMHFHLVEIELEGLLHWLIFLSGVFLMIAAFIGEKYVRIEAFKEEITNFELMLDYMIEAKKELDLTPNGSNTYKNIVRQLGIRSLEENSKWLIVHSREKAKPVLE